MSAQTAIEWTDRTWNPLTGCTKVSPGCDHCYAKTMHERFNGPGSFDTITLHPERLTQPFRWRAKADRPSLIFVNSMSDLFHHDVPDEYIAQVFAVMTAAYNHTFQLLTKRHARMRSLLSSPRWAELLVDSGHWDINLDPEEPAPNVWLGVSVENQQWADIRIPALLDTPAAVRFLSCEPLLGPVDLTKALARRCWHCDGTVLLPGLNYSSGQKAGPPNCWHCNGRDRTEAIDWVIVGGESGRGARLMQADWALSIRDQCGAAGVPFLFKQWGEWVPTKALSVGHLSSPREQHGEIVDDGKLTDVTWRRLYHRVGKKAAGRILDGRTWDEYPARAA